MLLHPAVWLSIGLLLLNDHYLKARYGNWWTGKLSDFAGMIFFPFLLQAAWELLLSLFGRFQRRSNLVLVVCMLLTALVFGLSQVTTWGAYGYRWGLGWLQWLTRGGPFLGSPWLPVKHTADPTDLLGLLGMCITWWVGHQKQP